MATLAPFVLSRATATDISPITDLMYDSFPDPTLRRIFMGCHSKAELPHLQQNYVRLMTTDPGDVWIKITERESGRIVAASSWKVHINGIPPGHDLDELPMWLGEGEDLEQARRVQGEWDGARRRNMTGPFLRVCTLNFSQWLFSDDFQCRSAYIIHHQGIPETWCGFDDDGLGLSISGSIGLAGLDRGVGGGELFVQEVWVL